jgi:hypothetical protein
LTAPAAECKKLSASETPDNGRHHVGTPGDIISECPGDFVGIRSGDMLSPAKEVPLTNAPAVKREAEEEWGR